jgi:hypothetical protein
MLLSSITSSIVLDGYGPPPPLLSSREDEDHHSFEHFPGQLHADTDTCDHEFSVRHREFSSYALCADGMPRLAA